MTPADTLDAVMAALSDRPRTLGGLTEASGLRRSELRRALNILIRLRLIEIIGGAMPGLPVRYAALAPKEVN